MSCFKIIKDIQGTRQVHHVLVVHETMTRLIGIPVHPSIVNTLNNEELYPIEQIIIDESFGSLGPGGCRALRTAILGTGPGM